MTDHRTLLLDLFNAAVDAVVPQKCLLPHLPDPQTVSGRIVIVGAGKAAAEMALIADQYYGDRASGLVVTRYGHIDPDRQAQHIEVVEASHPVPDAEGEIAARRMLDLVSELQADDLVICLLSGGGSALLSAPAAGLTLADKQAVTTALLRSGATISQINTVRKHLSDIKGGRLALAAAPARMLTLAISDVPHDDVAVIASGPTVPDPTSFADARALMVKFNISGPETVVDHLAAAVNETAKPGDPAFVADDYKLIATPRAALDAAAATARDAGYEIIDLGDSLEGETQDVARDHAALARQYLRDNKRVAILSGGETTVTIRGDGRGGPNAEYILTLTTELKGEPGISAIACDTDGVDGSEDNAGAMTFSDTLARATAKGLQADAFLANNDSWGFFKALDDLVICGPTQTNVNDFRAILVDPKIAAQP